MLNWMERIIRMRKEVPEIGWGDFKVLRTKSFDVLAMRYDWRGNSVVTVHNLGANPCEIVLDVGMDGGDRRDLVNLLSMDHSMPNADGGHRIVLEPYGYRWYRVGGLQNIMKRTEV
jgi:maltose alpha-D-glucosyltransferase/alpha-amylase